MRGHDSPLIVFIVILQSRRGTERVNTRLAESSGYAKRLGLLGSSDVRSSVRFLSVIKVAGLSAEGRSTHRPRAPTAKRPPNVSHTGHSSRQPSFNVRLRELMMVP